MREKDIKKAAAFFCSCLDILGAGGIYDCAGGGDFGTCKKDSFRNRGVKDDLGRAVGHRDVVGASGNLDLCRGAAGYDRNQSK